MPLRDVLSKRRYHASTRARSCILVAATIIGVVSVDVPTRAFVRTPQASVCAEVPPTSRAEAITSVDAYTQRKDHYIDALLAADSTSWRDWPGLDATKGIALLERAERTGDMSRVAEANEYVNAELDNVDASTWGGALQHGGPLALLTAYLRYEDRPELLYPATKDRIKTGRQPDGTVDEDHSLLVYKELIFNLYTVDDVNFDIDQFNPWQPQPTTGYHGTENHKLQILTVAMLLTEVYADESFRGYPVKDVTDANDDFWHYFRDAFFRYSSKWEEGYPTDHFGGDVNGVEKDASQYTRVYVQDYWLIRDLYSDPIVSKHAEILLDRTLIDLAEDTVMGMHTGSAGRYYTPDPVEGINQHVHVLNYLLFGNLGYELPLDHSLVWGFGAYGYANILTSGYDPTSPDFPKAIVDLAIDKEDGYLSRNGIERQANWVEEDFALGFRVNGVIYGDGQSGGFNVYDKLARGAGLSALMYYGDTPFQKDRPRQTLDGVVDRRVALIRDYNEVAELKLWIKDGFDTVEVTSTWVFISQPSSGGREIYLAVGPSTFTFDVGPAITDPLQTGTVLMVTYNGDPLIWEVSTSDEHPTFEAFKSDVRDNVLSVTENRITYASSALGTELSYDRLEHTAHEINGVPVDWAEFDHGFQTPWSSNPYGSHQASVDKNGYSVSYDWDPDDDGNFDEMPSKIVDNGGPTSEPATAGDAGSEPRGGCEDGDDQ